MNWKCLFGLHTWERWQVTEVKIAKLVEVNLVDNWVDTFQRRMTRVCSLCGLYQERSA